MISPNSTVEEILNHVWGMLLRGGADAKHAYHFPSLATHGSAEIEQRTVVLRKANKNLRQLICYSDRRTQKMDDLAENNQAHWLFYDHGSKEQIRAKASVAWHWADEDAKTAWQNIPPKNRGDYVGPLPPGTHTTVRTDNLPDDFKNNPTVENTQSGIENFVLVVSTVYQLDFLKLSREGHLRAQFSWNNNQWKGSWVAP
ncbi:pyridoxamine 5'-phosphate oxidase family protein [Tunicatimonas pelagia]|uniref:pyridoxamine 5'-phosphate oxidase family protein n=1 Tax=Tunicatimonas pelagia TaxID=931531 RepID=UPI0026668343|nr:pyridoxamine 5'-phosphate oxidase family protein [Tunicatimonas pelagia]WKN42490.1 pyridoxamine 5'-phosphate oxidase family protein [Tunicatimonas pelagia]